MFTNILLNFAEQTGRDFNQLLDEVGDQAIESMNEQGENIDDAAKENIKSG